MEPVWKGQDCLNKVAKFGPFPCTILYKSCLFYPSTQASSFERPPSWVAFITGFQYISIYHKSHIHDMAHELYTEQSKFHHWHQYHITRLLGFVVLLIHMDIALPYVIFSIGDPLTVWSFIVVLSFSTPCLFVMHFCIDYDCLIISVLVHRCTTGWNGCMTISCSCIRQNWV